jgi:hypothetical protein
VGIELGFAKQVSQSHPLALMPRSVAKDKKISRTIVFPTNQLEKDLVIDGMKRIF